MVKEIHIQHQSLIHDLFSTFSLFSSLGGLTIDYLKDDGSLDSGKVLPDAVSSTRALCAVIQKSPPLKHLIDSRADFAGDATLPKDSILPLCDGSAVAPALAAVSVQPQQQPVAPAMQPTPSIPSFTHDTQFGGNAAKAKKQARPKKSEEDEEDDDDDDEDDEEDDDDEDDEDGDDDDDDDEDDE